MWDKFKKGAKKTAIVTGLASTAVSAAAPTGIAGVLASVGIGSALATTAVAAAPILGTVAAITGTVVLACKVISEKDNTKGVPNGKFGSVRQMTVPLTDFPSVRRYIHIRKSPKLTDK